MQYLYFYVVEIIYKKIYKRIYIVIWLKRGEFVWKKLSYKIGIVKMRIMSNKLSSRNCVKLRNAVLMAEALGVKKIHQS